MNIRPPNHRGGISKIHASTKVVLGWAVRSSAVWCKSDVPSHRAAFSINEGREFRVPRMRVVSSLGLTGLPLAFVFELRSGLELLFRRIRIGVPLLVVWIVVNVHGARVDRDIVGPHAEEAAD